MIRRFSSLHAARSANARPAYSLIEMLVVITITVVLLSFMYKAIVSVLRRTSEPDATITRFESVATATARLRQDMRRADTIGLDPAGAILTAASGGFEWKIATDPFRLERRESGANPPLVFGLSGFRSGRFERFEIPTGTGAMVRLVLEPAKSRRISAGRSADDSPYMIEFAVGSLSPAAIGKAEAESKAASGKGEKP